MFANANTYSQNFTTTAGYNYMSAGPVTVASGITITVSTGSVWVIV